MRPHSEFFQSQWLPWLASDLGGMRPDVLVRTLSLDSDSGACSLIVRYPPGYCCVAHTLDVDEEFFVLSGALRIGEQEYAAHTYAHLPRLYPRAAISSGAGADVLTLSLIHISEPTRPY